MKLLIVEDNVQLAESIQAYLSREGSVCELAGDFNAAMDKLSGFDYDVVVLDIMLPDGNGLDVLRIIQTHHPETAVLIISAKNALEDKIKGLDLGADDYLPKPFDLSELNARLKAIYRRRNLNGSNEIILDEIKINTDNLEVMVNDQMLDLTRKEYELLVYLVVNKNRVLTKQAIAEHLWGDYMDDMDSFEFVYQHIKNLRKKITSVGGKDYIRTMYGSGYKFYSLTK